MDIDEDALGIIKMGEDVLGLEQKGTNAMGMYIMRKFRSITRISGIVAISTTILRVVDSFNHNGDPKIKLCKLKFRVKFSFAFSDL